MNPKSCSLKNFIPVYECVSLIDWDNRFSQKAPLDVEIGFGLAEHLIALAQGHPERNYIGIEQDRKRLLKAAGSMTVIEKKDPGSLANVRLLGIDAWIAFERLIPADCLENIYCLFPCPWPKKKHIRFRLFSSDFLNLLNSRLKNDGVLLIVTDFEPYVHWVVNQSRGTGFSVHTRTIATNFNTKFERKWKETGQQEFFEIRFVKKTNVTYPVKKEIELKAYKVKHFDPDRFVFFNQEGETAIILKDMFFDPVKQHAMVRLVVSEPNLTQHFWVSVAKKEEEWTIYRSVGQNLLQTQALAQALERVYVAVQSSGK